MQFACYTINVQTEQAKARWQQQDKKQELAHP